MLGTQTADGAATSELRTVFDFQAELHAQGLEPTLGGHRATLFQPLSGQLELPDLVQSLLHLLAYLAQFG